MAIGAVLVFDGLPPTQEEFLALVRRRLHLLPRLRQRLLSRRSGSGRRSGSTTRPSTCAATSRRATLPQPGSDEEFRSAGRRAFARRSTHRPLWELTLVEGFAEERFAVLYKTHHAMADGISAVDIGMLLFDVEPAAGSARPEEPWRPHRPPSGAGLVGHAAAGILDHAAPPRSLADPRRSATPPTPRAAPATGSPASGRSPSTSAGRPQGADQPAARRLRPRVRLGHLRPRRVQADQERPRRHRQRRLARRRHGGAPALPCRTAGGRPTASSSRPWCPSRSARSTSTASWGTN